MNTPIYDALVAELREQRYTTTAPFPRATVPATPPTAPPPSGWFTPAATPAPPAPPAAPPGLRGLAAILARTSLEHAPIPAPALIGVDAAGACA